MTVIFTFEGTPLEEIKNKLDANKDFRESTTKISLYKKQVAPRKLKGKPVGRPLKPKIWTKWEIAQNRNEIPSTFSQEDTFVFLMWKNEGKLKQRCLLSREVRKNFRERGIKFPNSFSLQELAELYYQPIEAKVEQVEIIKPAPKTLTLNFSITITWSLLRRR